MEARRNPSGCALGIQASQQRNILMTNLLDLMTNPLDRRYSACTSVQEVFCDRGAMNAAWYATLHGFWPLLPSIGPIGPTQASKNAAKPPWIPV
jgi:hypothetical protein